MDGRLAIQLPFGRDCCPVGTTVQAELAGPKPLAVLLRKLCRRPFGHGARRLHGGFHFIPRASTKAGAADKRDWALVFAGMRELLG